MSAYAETAAIDESRWARLQAYCCMCGHVAFSSYLGRPCCGDLICEISIEDMDRWARNIRRRLTP